MSSKHSSSSSLPLSPTASSSSHRVDHNKPNPFAGHGSLIHSACYSPDGRRIATGGNRPPIRIWDSYTGEMLLELQGHSDGVTSVCYSSDGQRLVSGWRDGSICVWNAIDGELVWEHAKAHGWNTMIACSADNRHIASGGGDGKVRIWRTEDMAQTMEIASHRCHVNSVRFSPDGRRLTTGCGDGNVRVFDVATGTLVVELQGQGEMENVVYSSDGKWLASSLHRTIRVWDASTGGLLFDLTGHTSDAHCLAFSPDGKQILSGSSDHTICFWDLDEGKRIGQPVRRHVADVVAASFAPDGIHFMTGAKDGSMRVWDAQTREVILPKLTEAEKERYQGPFRGHISEIRAVAYFLDGSKVVSLSVDRTTRIWDVHTGKQVTEPLDGDCYSISVSSDGSRLVGGGYHGVIIWDTHSGDVILGPLGDLVLRVAFSPDDKLIAGVCNDEIIPWDSRTGQRIRSMKAHDCVRAVSFSRDGTRLASGGVDMAVYVWDVATGETVAGPFRGHTDYVNCVAFSPDGLCIVSGSSDHTLRLWNATTGVAILGPLKTSSWVTSVLYSPDGTRICSTSDDKTMCLWDAHTGDLIHGPLEYGGGIMCAVYSPDGKHIFTGSRDGSLTLCDAATGEIIHVSDADSDHCDPSDSFLNLPATGILAQPQHGQHIQAPVFDWSFDPQATTPAGNNVAARTTPIMWFSFSRLRNIIVNAFQNNSPPDPNAHDQPTRTFTRPLSHSRTLFSFASFHIPFVNTSRRRNPPTDEDGMNQESRRLEDNWVAEARTRPIYAFQTGPLPDEVERGCFFHLASYICYGRRDPNIIASSHNLTYVGSPPGSQATASHGNVPHTYPPAPAMTTTAPTAIPSRTSHIQALLGQLFTFLRSPPRSGVSTSPSIPGATNADPVIPIVVITSPSPGAANGPSDVAAARQALAASPSSTNASVPSSDCPPSTPFITPAISSSPVKVVEPRSTSPETLQCNSATLQSTSGQSSPLPVTADVSAAVQGPSTADFALRPFTPSTGVLIAAMNTPLPPSCNSVLVSESSPAVDIHRASLGVNVASDTFSFDEVALVHHYRQLKVSLGIPAGGSSSSSTALLST